MRKFGCLLIGLICFVSIVGVYAFNILKKMMYIRLIITNRTCVRCSDESSGRPANNCWMKV